jgi:1-phosphofructokinase family hexose kinase
VSEESAPKPHRILAAGLSPARQQILVFDRFRPGEVNRASEVHWCGSGKVLNVGIALAQLSGATSVCRTLSVIGARARSAIEPEMAALGVECRWIETQRPTRICTTILDRSTGQATELVENAPPLSLDEVARFRAAFGEEAADADAIVLSGSLPAGTPVALYRELLEMTHARAILDARGPELLAALERRPFLVKPNREELAQTVGRELSNDADLHTSMRELNQRGAEWVVVTHGANAAWASHGDALYRVEPLIVSQVVNAIGSGDCLAAAVAWASVTGTPMLDALRFGIGAAAENLGTLLPARLDPARVAKLAAGVRVEVVR